MLATFKTTKRTAPTMSYDVLQGGATGTIVAQASEASFYNNPGAGGFAQVNWTAAADL